MKISKANKQGALIRDRVAFIIKDARPGVTYAARIRNMKVSGGVVVREWSIFSAGTTRNRTPKKAKAS